jgi:hypothetical protein
MVQATVVLYTGADHADRRLGDPCWVLIALGEYVVWSQRARVALYKHSD